MDSADASTPHGLEQAENSANRAPVAKRHGDAVAAATRALERAGVAEPRREARLLAAHVLGVGASALLDPATPVDAAAFGAVVARRAGREPLAYITGRRGFWTLDLAVSPATLVPRADSETLIEAATGAVGDRLGVRRVLDLGTGTGCLLLAALGEFPRSFGVGVDISPAAAAVAARNARACGLAGRAAFVAGSWAASLSGRFDLILSNPPYIETAAIASLMPEVAAHEPRAALDGGADGLEAYRQLMAALPVLLSAGGVAVLEMGAGQGVAVACLAAAAGLAHVGTANDLGGVARAMVLRRGRRP